MAKKMFSDALADLLREYKEEDADDLIMELENAITLLQDEIESGEQEDEE